MVIPQEYRLPLSIALGFHLLMVALLSFNGFTVSAPSKPLEIVAGEPIITANAVSSKDVAVEIKRLARVEQNRLEKIQEDQEKLRLEKEAAEKAREEALVAIAVAKKQKEELKKKMEAEKKREEALKQKEAELARKEELKKKEEQQKAVEAKKMAEAKKIADKKQADLAAKQKADKLALESQEGERISSEVVRYQTLITQKIRQNWTVQGNVRGNMQGKLHIRLAPGGSVIEVKLIQSSGDDILDRSAMTAVYRSSPLPVALDTKVFNELRDITWVFKPADTLSTR